MSSNCTRKKGIEQNAFWLLFIRHVRYIDFSSVSSSYLRFADVVKLVSRIDSEFDALYDTIRLRKYLMCAKNWEVA